MISKKWDINACMQMDNKQATELKKRRRDSKRLSFLLILETFNTYNAQRNEKDNANLTTLLVASQVEINRHAYIPKFIL